jgi:maleate isomerase/arylmalonate decarboxylase
METVMVERHKSAYSSRAEISLITPPTNTGNEAEWQRMMAEGGTFQTLPLHPDTAGEVSKAGLTRDLVGMFGMLRQARVDVIAFAGTGSTIKPLQSLPDPLAAEMRVVAVT